MGDRRIESVNNGRVVFHYQDHHDNRSGPRFLDQGLSGIFGHHHAAIFKLSPAK
jgi:hypothetical protein